MTTGASTFERPPKPQLPPFAGLPDLPALRELQARPKWVAWEYTWNESRKVWDKPPLNAKDGKAGSTTNAATWAPYDAAAAFATRRVQAGVGYVLSSEDEESGIDLDHCRDAETGKLQAWAQVAVDFAETYTEVSPSGCGLRFFVRGRVDGRKVDAAQVEIYTGGRYLTVTGRHVPGTPSEIREAPRLVTFLQERADQIRDAQRVAADLAREVERRKAERRAQGAPKQTTSERATASTRERGPRERSDFWRAVNKQALANLGAWVTRVFPSARFQSGTGAYRVDQRDLGEGYEEDLSLHPDGIRDFGCGDMGDKRNGGRSPIDIVKDYLPAADAAAAAMWLCERLSVRPEDIGWKGGKRDKNATTGKCPNAQADPTSERKSIRATRFVYRDPTQIPRREWLLGRHLIRKFISTTVSPGGVGKSSLTIAEALSLVTGRKLIGHEPHGMFRVWLWNGEDPEDELQRRIMATAIHYGITEANIGGRLFVNSGRDTEIVIARQERTGTTIATPVVEAIRATILDNMIDVVVIDPFVSCHFVNENDNGAINAVATAWAQIADSTGTAIELVHHARKTGGQEVTAEDARGAIALLSKARAARVLNPMTKDEAERAGVETRGIYFRVDRGKANLAPPSTDTSSWFKMASVELGNGRVLNVGGKPSAARLDGDNVGVVEAWHWPDPMASLSASDLRAAQAAIREGGPWRENSQAKDWAGIPIARAIHLDLNVKADREKVKRALRAWIANGMFVVVQGQNEKRRPTPMIEVGEPAGD